MAQYTFPLPIRTMTLSRPRTNIYYPQIALHNAGSRRINHAIVQAVNALVQKQLSTLYGQLEEMNGNYEIKTNERSVLSLTLSNYTYMEHAAHGMTLLKGMTFEYPTGKQYSLEDLFKPGSDYVNKINEMIKAQLATLDLPLLDEFKSIRPDQDFYIADKALVIFFQLYEITPYYVGFPMFPLSVFQLQDIINEDGPLVKMATYN